MQARLEVDSFNDVDDDDDEKMRAFENNVCTA